MSVQDLINSDPYYQNLVNPRGFLNTNVSPTTPTINVEGTGGTPNLLGNPIPSSNQGGIQSLFQEINGGGGGGGNGMPISTSGLIGDFMEATQNRTNRLTNPSKLQGILNSGMETFGITPQRDIGEMIRSGQVDVKNTSGIPLGIGSAISRMLPDGYNDMSLLDQVFTQSQMGYNGPTVFGENSMGNKDPFGLNVRSGFGNYGEAVNKNFNQLRDTLTKDRDGVTFNEETGMYEGLNADAVNQKTKNIRNKYLFREKQLGVKKGLDTMIKQASQKRKIKAAAEEKARQTELDRRQAIANAQAARGQTTSGGRGNYRSDRDNSRDGGYGGSSKRSADNRSSDLGFSDIRLKDNIELVGKSPSDINIYNFTYLNDPKVYQGVMAQEVPWASVKHDSGYLMVDYSKVDVEFKRKDAIASMFTRRR